MGHGSIDLEPDRGTPGGAGPLEAAACRRRGGQRPDGRLPGTRRLQPEPGTGVPDRGVLQPPFGGGLLPPTVRPDEQPAVREGGVRMIDASRNVWKRLGTSSWLITRRRRRLW